MTTETGSPTAACRLPLADCGMRIVEGVLWVVVCLAGVLTAQTPTAGLSGQAQPEQAPLFKFYVWGQVRAPGAYGLGANPDIVELLSAGGGPTDQADLNRVVLVRGVDQRRRSINLNRLLDGGQTVTLSPGDVVIVPEAFWYRFRDEIAIVSTLATFVTLYFSVYNATRTARTLGSH